MTKRKPPVHFPTTKRPRRPRPMTLPELEKQIDLLMALLQHNIAKLARSVRR